MVVVLYQLSSFDQTMKTPFLEEFLVEQNILDRVKFATEKLVAFFWMLFEERK